MKTLEQRLGEFLDTGIIGGREREAVALIFESHQALTGRHSDQTATRVERLAEVWERVADGRANDEKLMVSGYQAHDTAHGLREAADALAAMKDPADD